MLDIGSAKSMAFLKWFTPDLTHIKRIWIHVHGFYITWAAGTKAQILGL